MAVGFDIMNMILVKRHCLLERVWKRLCNVPMQDDASTSLRVEMWNFFRYALGMMSFLREILRALEV